MAFEAPVDFRFADSHEYVSPQQALARVGLSAYAVEQLGDIVFVELPEVGERLSRGSSFGSVESVKAVEDLFAPVSGVIEQRNDGVLASPEELQNDPHGEGWLLQIRLEDSSELEALMDPASYAAKVEGG